MENKKEIKIGIFSFVIILASIWGYQFLKGNNLLVRNNIYYATYEDVEQLPVNSEILLRGTRVGAVTKIFFDDNLENIVIELNVDKSIPVPKDAEVHIISTGIASQKAVELVFERKCMGANCAESGDYLIGVNKGLLESMVSKDELKSYLNIIKNEIGDIIDTIGTRMEDTDSGNRLIETVNNFSLTIANLERITRQVDQILERSARDISEITSKVNYATDSLGQQMRDLSKILKNINTITESFQGQNIGERISGTLEKVDGGMDQFTTTLGGVQEMLMALNEGKGTLGKLLQDPEVANNLGQTLKNVNMLMEDIRLNPHRYTHLKVSIFGKGKRDEYEPPEEVKEE